jgi:ubiquitin C
MPNDGSVNIRKDLSQNATMRFVSISVLTKRMVDPTTVIISVSSSDTIEDIKNKVATELAAIKGSPKIVFESPILRHGKKILEDDTLICECNLNSSDTLYMTEMMQIFVKGLDGKTMTFLTEYGPYGTKILHFKKLLAQKLQEKGYGKNSPHIMRLLAQSRQLEDHKTFWDYNIQKETTLQLMLRLRGGMFHASSGFRAEEEVEEDPFLSSLLQQAVAAQSAL